jgi:hypothetical protein
MTKDDPPPNVDRTYQDDVDPVVRDFLDAMKVTETGTGQIDPAIQELFTSKFRFICPSLIRVSPMRCKTSLPSFSMNFPNFRPSKAIP